MMLLKCCTQYASKFECRGQGPHLAMTGEPRGVSGVVAGFSSFDGEYSLPHPFLVSVFILCERVKSWANGPHSCLESIFTSYKSSACSGILSTPSDSEALSIKGDFPFWDGRIPYLPILVFLPSYCHTTFVI